MVVRGGRNGREEGELSSRVGEEWISGRPRQNLQCKETAYSVLLGLAIE